MKAFLLITLFFFSISAQANMRVMSFNTTCSFCEKGKFDKFKYRKHWIVDTIKRNNPDLIGLQEVFFPSQLRWFKDQLKDYRLIYSRKFYIFKYADPALFIKKSRFTVKKWGGFWLGPLGRWFSLGWKMALPRRVQWTKLLDHETNQQFYFASSHFDNRLINKNKSAKVFTKAFSHVKLPVILAADTNLKNDMDGFLHITENYHNALDVTENLEFIKNSDTNKDDSCNLEKAKVFPYCMVDHIFMSKEHHWKVLNYAVDQFKYGSNNRFTSDHRAIFADIELN